MNAPTHEAKLRARSILSKHGALSFELEDEIADEFAGLVLPVPARLARHLLILPRIRATYPIDPIVNLNQTQAASYLGAARSYVSTLINKWIRDGILERGALRGELVILREPDLRAIVRTAQP